MNCTDCKDGTVVLRPCEFHRDTHCGPISKLLKTMDTGNPHRHKHSNKHHQRREHTDDIVWRYGNDVGKDGSPEEQQAVAMEVASSEAPFSSAETLVWDWQAVALTTAVFACILFFLVITLYSLHQARQWRRLKENFEAGKCLISSLVPNNEAASSIGPKYRYVTYYRIYYAHALYLQLKNHQKKFPYSYYFIIPIKTIAIR